MQNAVRSNRHSGEEVFSDDVDENVAPEKPQHLEQSALLGHASLLWTCCEPPDLGELQGACWEEIHPLRNLST